MNPVEYDQWRTLEGFCFAIEYSYEQNNTLRKAFKYYNFPTLELFLRWYCSQNVRHVHELIRPLYPARFFIDVDDTKKSPDFEAFVTDLDVKCRRLICDELLVKDPQMFPLEAHREDKWSTHLIYSNVIFQGYEQMFEFAQKVHIACGTDKRMDMHLYSPTRPRRLRIAYSCSIERKNPLVPKDKTMSPIDVLLQSLVTAMPKTPLYVQVSSTFMEKEETNSMMMSANDRILNWFRLMFTDADCKFKIYASESNATNATGAMFTIQPGLKCVAKGGYFHKTQGTFFIVRYNGQKHAEGVFKCADSECRHFVTPYIGNLSAVAFPRNIFLN